MRFHLSAVLAVAVVLAVLEATLLGFVQVRGVVPDLMLLFALFLSLHLPVEESMAANWLLGLCHDLGTGAAFGSSGFLFLLVGSLVSLLQEIFFQDSVSIQLLLVFAVSFLYNSLYGAALARAQEAIRLRDVFAFAAKIAAYTAVVGPAAFHLLHRFRRVFLDSRR